MSREFLCRLSDLPDGDSQRVDFADDDHASGLCVVRRGRQVFAYLNRCPHQELPMDWQPGRFLDMEREHIVCAMHGARFRIEDGFCVDGPCRGQHLQAAAVCIEGDQVFLQR